MVTQNLEVHSGTGFPIGLIVRWQEISQGMILVKLGIMVSDMTEDISRNVT